MLLLLLLACVANAAFPGAMVADMDVAEVSAPLDNGLSGVSFIAVTECGIPEKGRELPTTCAGKNTKRFVYLSDTQAASVDTPLETETALAPGSIELR